MDVIYRHLAQKTTCRITWHGLVCMYAPDYTWKEWWTKEDLGGREVTVLWQTKAGFLIDARSRGFPYPILHEKINWIKVEKILQNLGLMCKKCSKVDIIISAKSIIYIICYQFSKSTLLSIIYHSTIFISSQQQFRIFI